MFESVHVYVYSLFYQFSFLDKDSPGLLRSVFTRMALGVSTWADFDHAYWGLLREHHISDKTRVRFSPTESVKFNFFISYHINYFVL